MTALHRPPSLWGGGPLRCPSPKPHPRIGPSGHVTGVPPNFEILATPLHGAEVKTDMPEKNEKQLESVESVHVYMPITYISIQVSCGTTVTSVVTLMPGFMN